MQIKTKIMLTRQNGENKLKVNISNKSVKKSISTPSGKVKVAWSKEEKTTSMGGLVYFTQFLDATGLFEYWIKTCPLIYGSNNAHSPRDILGTILLSILNGHTRYGHITTLRGESLSSGLLKMEKIPSEESIRRGLCKLVEETTQEDWVRENFDKMSHGLLETSWIMDVDVTIKTIYGKQDRAEIGYNPHKPGRPSHAYHSFWIGKLRFCLGVEVHSGNKTAGSYGLDFIKKWFQRHPPSQHPSFIRGDIGYGTEKWMSSLEEENIHYLFKLRQTRKVKELINLIEIQNKWTPTEEKWMCSESEICLSGWSKSRRVVVYRRIHILSNSKGKPCVKLIGSGDKGFLPLEILEENDVKYEYAIYITDLALDKELIGPSYRDRGDNENCYDELKNQWGWGGFKVSDLARCQLMASTIALIYNWWSVFVKFVDNDVAREAITSRPLFLNHVARSTIEQRQRVIKLFCAHGFVDKIQEKLQDASDLLTRWMTLTAEQLKQQTIWSRIILHIIKNHKKLGIKRTLLHQFMGEFL